MALGVQIGSISLIDVKITAADFADLGCTMSVAIVISLFFDNGEASTCVSCTGGRRYPAPGPAAESNAQPPL
jgi:hypothetical protein